MELLPHQVSGVEWMLGRENSKISGGILCDEMGLGKTVQTIRTIIDNPKKHTLIVVPKSIVEQWVSELGIFAPQLSVCMYSGTRRKFMLCDVCVCPYSVVVDLVEQRWDRIVLDEGHEIRNTSSLIHKTCMSLKADTRWILTGTPVFNTMKDFVSLCSFIRIPRKRVQAYYDDIKKEYVLRRLKSEVTEIIPYDFENVELEMTPMERELYTQVYDDITSEELFEGLLRCRQVCAWPQLYFDGIHKKYGGPKRRWKGITAKFKWLLHSIKSHPSEKSLVFTQFKAESLAICARIEHFLKRDVFILDGSTENRNEVIQNFKKSTDGSVFIIQIKTGGVGLNLKEATRVYIMQPSWNPATELQAIARSHRGDQMKKVYVKKLVYSGADVIDTELVELQNIKSVLCSQVLGDSTQIIPKTNTVSNFIIRIGKKLYDIE